MPDSPLTIGIDFDAGLVHSLTNVQGWTSIPLWKILQQATNLPVIVENDAKCMGFAEWKCGAGRGFQHVVFISLGTGVGGAIIANGQMIRGARHGAGEIGQTSIDYQGRPGHYGNLGALEDYVVNREITAMAHDAYRAAGIQKALDECSPAAHAAHLGDPAAFGHEAGTIGAAALAREAI